MCKRVCSCAAHWVHVYLYVNSVMMIPQGLRDGCVGMSWISVAIVAFSSKTRSYNHLQPYWTIFALTTLGDIKNRAVTVVTGDLII